MEFLVCFSIVFFYYLFIGGKSKQPISNKSSIPQEVASSKTKNTTISNPIKQNDDDYFYDNYSRNSQNYFQSSISAKNNSAKFKKMIQDAIDKDQSIEIEYTNAQGKDSQREIKPHSIFKMANKLCFRGFCSVRNEDRTFALRRIKSLIIMDNQSISASSPAEVTIKSDDVTDKYEILISKCSKTKIKTLDKTAKGGCLWFLVDKKSKKIFNNICDELGLKPTYTKKGSKTTNYQPSYYLKKSA
ncbi:WYL domain-containing protein [Bacteriovorax sp. Seq25_V]|uniref:WYL domain-containing protein n=1 Tax=Bacteriovorax sp. Seq25_V TaxID=1201288 RepID=UPI00038A4CC7|nr:WYL domain-containing protein [Bacteriovorax sp. Seq25_V]EQC47250.1 WYL domain protein [Bacteriovorax sp. Seq25_V]